MPGSNPRQQKQKIMEREELYELVEENNLKVVETTEGVNGYPNNLNIAITGFDTYEEAKAFADEHNMEVVGLQKNDGWDLWEKSKYGSNPIDATAFQSDDAKMFFDEDDLNDEINRWAENAEDMPLDDKMKAIRQFQAVYDELRYISNGEFVVLENGEAKTLDRFVTELQYDNKKIITAVMRR